MTEPFEPVVMHLPLTSTLVEKMVTDVRISAAFLAAPPAGGHHYCLQGSVGLGG